VRPIKIVFMNKDGEFRGDRRRKRRFSSTIHGGIRGGRDGGHFRREYASGFLVGPPITEANRMKGFSEQQRGNMGGKKNEESWGPGGAE